MRSVKPPTGTTPLSRPHQTALDGSGGYWIADTNNNRVVHLASDGARAAEHPDRRRRRRAASPRASRWTPTARSWCPTPSNNRVERYIATTGALIGTVAASGTGAGQVSKPGGLLVTGTGAVAPAVDRRRGQQPGDRARRAPARSRRPSAPPEPAPASSSLPQGVAVDPTDGDIAVADFGNNRISLWDPEGGTPPVDTANPTVAFTTPASGASLPAGTVAVAGTSSDDTSVSAVDVQVQRSSDSQWLQANGTWGASQPSGCPRPWHRRAGPARAGRSRSRRRSPATYSMTARVTDQAAKTGTATRSFSVAAQRTRPLRTRRSRRRPTTAR